jgi:glycosyltransferase involved in cell wall biosynthesis
MDIAFVHPDYPGAEGTGATHSATRLVELLADRSHDLTVFCRRSPETGLDAVDWAPTVDSAEAIDGPTTVDLRALDLSGPPYHTATNLNRALRSRLRSGTFDRFDVVHSYLPSSLPAMGRIGERVSATVVVTLNAYGAVCPKNDLRYRNEAQCRERGLLRCGACALATSRGHEEFGVAYRAASRFGRLRLVRDGLARLGGVDCFQALSAHVKTIHEAFGFPANRTTVVPNPVDERFRVPHSSSFPPPHRDDVGCDLLYVGALERHKGVERLVPTLELVRESGIDATLTVVGGGGRRQAMEDAARERGIAQHVTFRGRCPYAELPAVYADHDCFVYPGEWDEPFGRVFLEALAAGTPVVATAVGSVADIVGEAGIVTDGSVEALAEGVTTAVRERGLRVLSDQCAVQLERFRPGRVVRGLESLYRETSESRVAEGGS